MVTAILALLPASTQLSVPYTVVTKHGELQFLIMVRIFKVTRHSYFDGSQINYILTTFHETFMTLTN